MSKVGSSSPAFTLKGTDKACRVFQGGSVGHLHKLLSIESSAQVSYPFLDVRWKVDIILM